MMMIAVKFSSDHNGDNNSYDDYSNRNEYD